MKNSSKQKAILRTGLAALVLLSGSARVQATVSLEVYFDDGDLPAGALAVIVADIANDGFFPLIQTGATGTVLDRGRNVGKSDDRIVALFHTTAGLPWSSGAGVADLAPSIDYAEFGIAENTPLIIYVFPELTQQGTTFILGDRYVEYRDTTSGASGGTAPFLAPADPGYYTIAAVTGANGGGFDPLSLTLTERYRRGSLGVTGGGEKFDESNTRQDAIVLGEESFSGNLTEGDLDFFQFTLVDPAVLNTVFSTELLMRAWIFDSDGNLVFSPEDGPVLFRGILPPGHYYLAIQGQDDEQAGLYTLSLVRRGVIQPRPDITVGKTAKKQKGDNVYSSRGSGQKYKTVSKYGASVTAYFGVQNDGDLDGPLVVTGPGGDRYYQLKYRSLGGGGNVTGSVKRGGYTTQYGPGRRILYRLDVLPSKSNLKKGKAGKFLISSSAGSQVDGAQVDVKYIKPKPGPSGDGGKPPITIIPNPTP